MNRREAIKRSAVTLGGLAFVPVLTGCTSGKVSDYVSGNGFTKLNFDNDDNQAFVNSVKALRGTPGNPGNTAFLTGYYNANDGGGSEVYWDSESAENDDGGMVFKVEGVSTGRWKRADAGYINIKWFGARGDGIYRSGRNNEVHIFDHCLNWIKNHSIKKIYVPKGLYILEHGMQTRIDSDHNGLELYGDGEESELKLHDNIPDVEARLWMLSWATRETTGLPIKDMYIHDIKFNGNRQGHKISMSGGNTGYALWVNGQPNLRKGEESFNIRIERVYSCNHNTSGFSIRTSNTEVKDCKSWGHFQHGLETHNDAKNVLIDGLTAWQCGNNISNTGYGVDFSSGENLKLTNFDIYDCWAGFKTSDNIQSVEITNGYFRNNWGRGIQQTSNPHRDYTLKIDNVTTENNPGGNRFDDMKSLTIGTFTSINDGDNNNSPLLINNNVRQFYAESLNISKSNGIALRVFSPDSEINHINITDSAGTAVQSRYGGNNVSINGGTIESINGDCVHARGSSFFKLSNIAFKGTSALRVDSYSVVEVTNCDFSGVTNSYIGAGTVTYIEG